MEFAPYFEQQEAQLCAQHALNALLQEPLFTAPDLAVIAQALDDAEDALNRDSENVHKAAKEAHRNMNDSGFFSVQVLQRALAVFDLALVHLPATVLPRFAAHKEAAFVMHLDEHWFTLRRFGQRWYNLNSLLPAPAFVGEAYLAELLHAIKAEGYTLFVVRNTAHQSLDASKQIAAVLPRSIQDTLALTLPPVPTPEERVAVSTGKGSQAITHQTGHIAQENDNEDWELALAIAASLAS